MNGETKSFFHTEQNHSRGVAILFKIGVDFKTEKLITDNEGRFIYADLAINDSVFNILNIYAPTSDRPCQPNFSVS